jgi:hypothetical protein
VSAGWFSPLEGPLSPQNRPVLPLPENTGRVDLGFPPPSHVHIIRGGSTRNEELPIPQPLANDFRKVLRKKHATAYVLIAAISPILTEN